MRLTDYIQKMSFVLSGANEMGGGEIMLGGIQIHGVILSSIFCSFLIVYLYVLVMH